MTAEIAVLNQEAAALAADSAVTGPKIFTSADKIFALSKYHPVGVMVYNSAQFLGVPWETIIKTYRKGLGTKSFPTLREHASHFLEFFDEPNPIFPPDTQRWAVKALFESGFQEIRHSIDERLEELLEEEGPLTHQQISAEVHKAITDAHRYWTAAGRSPALPVGHRTAVVKEYAGEIAATIKSVFQKLPLTEVARRNLRQLAGAYLTADIANSESPFHTGIVIAGFGADEMFPRLVQFEFEAISLNRLKYTGGEPIEISPQYRAVIVPFAQSEQVDTFMTGIDPDISKAISGYWTDQLHDTVKAALGEVTLDADIESELLAIVDKRCEGLLRRYAEGLEEMRQKDYVRPIIRVVAMLPKDELASMAESLVNLTSFKRRVSEQRETVGGPIDVAVISRGDGFIWIKRKHYFEPELNPHFAANYYREDL